jgi:hypothetical protein
MKQFKDAVKAEVRYIEDDAEGDEIWFVARIKIPTVVKIATIGLVAGAVYFGSALLERENE